jgi:transcriptional regulator with GAF, ATPase, and Fis domain
MLKGCINEINEVLNSSSNIGNSIYMIMETMYRGFEFNRVLFCMLDQKQTRMAARFGFGENIDFIQKNFEFRVMRSSDFFNIAVMRMKDIFVDDSQVPRIKENLPDWYLQLITARSFLILPLVIKEKCIGLLYADKKSPNILNDIQKYYMNILRQKAVWAILHKH